jgi:hypothetical protein
LTHPFVQRFFDFVQPLADPVQDLLQPLTQQSQTVWRGLGMGEASSENANIPTDLQVSDLDLVYDDKGLFDAYYFHLVEHEGGRDYPLHKVVKIIALDFVPIEAREQLSVLEKMRNALRGLYNADVDLVYLVCGIFKPVYLGITQCYGVIGYDAESREAANQKAERAMGALRAALANFEQSRFKPLTRAEVEWIRHAFSEMSYGLVGLGHPDPGRAAKSIQQQARRGGAMDEFTLEQNELLYRGMAVLSEEFLNVVMAFRVSRGEIIDLQARTASETSRWASLEKGSKGINVGLGIPLILSGALSHGASTGYGESQNVGVADATGHSTAHGQSVGVGHTVTQGEAHSDGVSDTTTVTHSQSVGQGISASDGKSHTDGTAHTDSRAHTESNSTTSTDSTTITDSSNWSHSESRPGGIQLPGMMEDMANAIPGVGGILDSISGGNLGGTAHGGVPADTLDGGLNAGVNFSTGTNTDTTGGGTSVSHGHSESSTHSSSDSWGTADTVSQSDGTSHSDGRSSNVSNGVAVSQSHTTSHTDTVSRTEGDSISLGESASESDSTARSVSRGLGQAESRALNETQGLGVGTGLAPNISLNKSYQWEDHKATLVADLLRGQERLLADAVTEGGFLVDNYYLCRTDRGRTALAELYAQAFTGPDSVTPAQTRAMTQEEFEYLRNRAMTFTPSTRRETQMGLLETYRDATFLTPLRLAAYTAIGLVEAGRAQTVQERIPPFAFNPHLTGEVTVGRQITFETGEPTDALCRLSREKMAHMCIVGDSGSGKSVLATWLEYQIATQWNYRVVIFDFGRGHRSLMKMIDPTRFDLYGLDESSPRRIRWNPLQVGQRIAPETQLTQTCEIIGAAGRLGQRQFGFLRDALRQLYLDHGVLTDDPEVQYPELTKAVKERPNDPSSKQRVRLAQVQPEERPILNAARAARGAPPLPKGPIFLHELGAQDNQDDLVRIERDLQVLAVHRSKAVDISLWYDRLELVQAGKRSGMPDHTAIEGILLRLSPFRYGALARMYGSGEDSIAIEDLGYPYGVAVLEGGTLAEIQKSMVLGLAAFHIYEDAIEKRKETMRKYGNQKAEHPMFLVLEEAHKIVSGGETASGDNNGSSSGIITVHLWGNLARDSRKYDISYALIGQSPSQFPEEMVTSCGIFSVHTLKGDKDRKMMMSTLAKSTMGFEDNAYLRFISRMPRAQAIWKTAISMDKKEVEPMLIETIMLPVDREPSDPDVRAHFELWNPLKQNLIENGGRNSGQG